ncbi:MAG: hypothetical protein E7412_03460 [Ruminococcaceae bacterium]|nr:hypothetical protein [Oscillospiraceae bacterium]
MVFRASQENLKSAFLNIIEKANPRYEKGAFIFDDDYFVRDVRETYLATKILKYQVEKYYDVAYRIVEKNCVKSHGSAFGGAFNSALLDEGGEELPEEIRAKVIAGYVSEKADIISPELDFVGINDNFPFMAMFTCCMAYKYTGDTDFLDALHRRASQLEKLLKRRGVISEYNAYTFHQLAFLAKVARVAPDEKIKNVAQNAQKRIWAEYLGHFNPQTGVSSGPISRQYLYNVETDYIFLHHLFGFEFPWLDIPSLEEMTCHFEVLDQLTEGYEVDEEVINLFKNKKYPFEFIATTEHSASIDATEGIVELPLAEKNAIYEYPAGEGGIYTYQTEYYGIGTATHDWHNGVQTSGIYIDYKRCAKPSCELDVRTVFARYLINDESNEYQGFMDQGRKACFGRKNKAVAMYKPKLAPESVLMDESDMNADLIKQYRKQSVPGNLGVTSAKLVIMVRAKSVMPDRIIVGDKVLDGTEYCSDVPKSVYIKDGDVYLAFHPLYITSLSGSRQMTVRNRNGELEIAFYNYKGEEKDFSRAEFVHARNGFAASVASSEEFGTFEEFVESECKTVVRDEFFISQHSRYTRVRSVSVNFEDMSLEGEYSPASEGIKFLSCNDYVLDFPKLSISGFDVSGLPYCEELK